MKKQKALITLICLLLVFALVGCGDGNNNGNAVAEELQDLEEVYEVLGFSYSDKFSVKVTIAENEIKEIEVVDIGKESPYILASAVDKLIPRIIEHQSLDVDSISGATLSSAGIKAAVINAITDAGGNPSNWYSDIEKSDETVVLEGYDVIVVGLGGAGTAAYISAAENGAAVFGIEKAGKIGGTSTNITGPMAINSVIKMNEQNEGKKFLEEEDLIEDWLEYTLGDAKEELVRFMVNESGATMDWLIENYGFEFSPIRAFFHPKGWEVWAGYDGSIDEMYNAAIEQAKAFNEKNDFMLELTATDLLTDAEGNVTGVKAAYYDGTTYEVHGKSVILATGGFAGNPELLGAYLGGTEWRTYAMNQNDGAGILMALDVGADVYNIDMPPMQHVASNAVVIRDDALTADDKAVLESLVMSPDTIIVGPDGERFLNEGGNIAFDSWQAGPIYYNIFSNDQIQQYKSEGLAYVMKPRYVNQGGTVEVGEPVENIEQILAVAVERGAVYTADTLEALAEQLEMSKLVEEIEKYNSYADGTEEDPFGKAAEFLVPIGAEGPFYAIKGAAYIYGTCAGLDININMNVLDTKGNAIPGLYAVGQDSMGVLFSAQVPYVTYGGAAHGWVLLSGREAGANAAQFSAK
ncbi:MAG: FAD-binding protein [Firmicutes bacterium]|nr:FAD-binding protein [Bacillota bacterium]